MDSRLSSEEKPSVDDTKEGENEERNLGREEKSTDELQQIDTRSNRNLDATLPLTVTDPVSNNQRVFMKSLPNKKMTLYLVNRDLIAYENRIDNLIGVLLVDPDYVENKRVYAQVTMTFRYGREDEEVMGINFCAERIIGLAQLYPPYMGADHQQPTPVQEALIRRLGSNAHAFTIAITRVVPPSVRLLPAKEYNGAPIGTSYDVKAYVAERFDEKLHRNTTVRMGIRVVQRTNSPAVPMSNLYSVSPTIQHERNPQSENEIVETKEPQVPHAVVQKEFLLNGGSIRLEAHLDRANYAHGDTIQVHVSISNDSHKSVRRIQVLVLQHVDVCMFSSGKFKNVVAKETEKENCPLGPGSNFTKTYNVKPTMTSTKNWIAIEDNYTKAGTTLASSVICPQPRTKQGGDDKDEDSEEEKERHAFDINISYYVKVKLQISRICGVVSLKLPFNLWHRSTEPDLTGFPSPIRNIPTTNANTEREEDKLHTCLAVMETFQCDGKVNSELVQTNQKADVNLIENREPKGST
ncbi:arrestin homolog [Chelonus insularis]|uniref:arrestin homolog n=1 Tax=Chelonus insularis TaxID=460826 RepID=UPI00158CAD3A|nr:arrestin homolog [Chelonus insularis]XP_034950702.1 arrestin homolog [Chelonus insularis]XP_034950710.1 arrestin homolog [Chelonus insularis]